MSIPSRSTGFRLPLLLLGCVSLLHAREITIVALGDSTTAGTPYFRSPLEAPPYGAGDPQAFYGFWMMKKEPTWEVLNLGINGQRTDEIRDRLNEAFESHPEYVVVLAGVNDIYQGVDPQETARNLAGIYREIQRHTIIPVAATVLPFDSATKAQAAKIRQLNAWIKKTADQFKIPLVDLNKAVADPANPNRLNASPDGLHPDIGSYRQMGFSVLKIIQEMEKIR
jgi:lysophospholipase L1-like esterase